MIWWKKSAATHHRVQTEFVIYATQLKGQPNQFSIMWGSAKILIATERPTKEKKSMENIFLINKKQTLSIIN